MANAILEDQSLDYTKPFTVEFTFRDSNGMKYTTVKTVYPMKVMVRKMAGKRTPWDEKHPWEQR